MQKALTALSIAIATFQHRRGARNNTARYRSDLFILIVCLIGIVAILGKVYYEDEVARKKSMDVSGSIPPTIKESMTVLSNELEISSYHPTSGPFYEIQQLEKKLQTCGKEYTEERCEVLETLADLYSHVKNPTKAIDYRKQSLVLKSKENVVTLRDVVSSYGAISKDYQDMGVYGESLTWLEKPKKYFDKLDNHSISLLYQMESDLRTCRNEPVQALEKLEMSLQLYPPNYHSKESIPILLQQLDMIQRVLKVPTGVSKEKRQTLSQKRKKVIKRIMKLGPYSNELQLPRVFIPKSLKGPN